MKKATLFVLVAAFIFSCKKDSGSSGDPLFSKYFENGKLEEEYIYDADGKMTQSKSYGDEMGVNVVKGITEYNYDKDGKLTEAISRSVPSNKVSSSQKYKLDASGNLSRLSLHWGAGSDSGEMYLYIDYKFNGNKRLVKQTWHDADGKVTNYRDMEYYDNGNMKSVISYNVSGLTTEKSHAMIFGPSDMVMPASLYNVTAMPLNYHYAYSVSSMVQNFGYEDGIKDSETEYHMSQKEYNAHGLVKKQKMALKKILPAGTDENYEWAYEYVTK